MDIMFFLRVHKKIQFFKLRYYYKLSRVKKVHIASGCQSSVKIIACLS